MKKNLGTIELSSDILEKTNIGLWALELDKGKEPRIYTNSPMLGFIGAKDSMSPEEMYTHWYSGIGIEHRGEVIEAVLKMRDGNHAEVQFPWHHPNGKTMLVRVGGVRNYSYTDGARIEGTFTDVTDVIHYEESEIRKYRQQDIDTINVLASEYSAVFLANLKDLTFINYRLDDTVRKLHPDAVDENVDIITSFSKYVVKYLDTASREKVLKLIQPDNLRRVLAEKKSVTTVIKTTFFGAPNYSELKIVTVKEEDGIPTVIALALSNKNQEIIDRFVAEKLAEEYVSLYAIDLDSDTISTIKMIEKYRPDDFTSTGRFTEAMAQYIGSGVLLPEYIPWWEENVLGTEKLRRYLGKEDTKSINVQHIDSWTRITFTVTERTEDGVVHSLLLGYVPLDSDMSEKETLNLKIAEQHLALEDANRNLTESKMISDLFLDSFISAYYVNTLTGEYKVLTRTEYLEDNYPRESTYFSSLEQYINYDVHPADREKMIAMTRPEYVLKRFETESRFSFLIRDISEGKNRVLRFFAMRAADGIHAAFGFTDVTAEYEAEREKEAVIEALSEDFLSVIYIDPSSDSDYLFRSNDESFIKRFPEWKEIHNFRERLSFIAENVVHPDDREQFLLSIKKDKILEFLSDNPAYYYNYRECIDGKTEFFQLKFVLIKSDPVQLVCGFKSIDAQTRKEVEAKKNLEQNLGIIRVLANEYTSVYYVDFNSDTLIPYSMNEETDNEFGEIFRSGISYSEALNLYINRVVYSGDREKMLSGVSIENIRLQLEEKNSFAETFRSDFSGELEYREMVVYKVGDDDTPTACVLAFSDKDKYITERMVNAQIYNDYATIDFCDIDADKITPIKTSKQTIRLMRERNNLDVYSCSSVFSCWADIVDDDAKQFWKKNSDLKYLKSFLADSDRKEFIYQASLLNHWYRADFHVLERDSEGDASKIVITQHIIDNEQAEKMKLTRKISVQNALLDGLAREYHTVILVDGETRLMKLYRTNGNISVQIARDNPDYASAISIYVNSVVFPDDRERVLDECDFASLDERIPENGIYSVTYRRINTEGSIDYHQMCFAKAKIEENRKVFILAYRDVDSEIRKQLHNRKLLEEALSLSESASKAKTSFLFNMSHDIRTPMNAIKGYTTLAKNHIDDSDTVQNYLDKIDVSGDQLLSLVNQILEMSRIESGKVVLSEEPADIIERVFSISTIITADAELKNIRYNTILGNIIHPNILTDVTRVNQIIINVVGNALKYTPDGGKINFYIDELPHHKENYSLYRFEISDTGIGMSEEFLAHIFEDFSRENNSTVSKIQGTGLGMSIVKKLIELFGGTINITSVKGAGTTVTINIPMKWDPDNTRAVYTPVLDATKLDGMRVLLVEDNEMNREIATEILSESGIEVKCANDGDIAVETVKNSEPGYYDIVLMDIQMPTMNGYEATKQIRALENKALADIPIIAMTANAFEEDRRNALNCGMNEHVAKPIDIPKLKQVIAKFYHKG